MMHKFCPNCSVIFFQCLNSQLNSGGCVGGVSNTSDDEVIENEEVKELEVGKDFIYFLSYSRSNFML